MAGTLILYGTLAHMSSLRILHVVPYYEQAWAYGGIPRLATAMTRGLARRGHQVSVCTTDVCDASSRVRPDRDATGRPGLRVHVFPNVSNRLAYHWQFFTPIGLMTHLRKNAGGFDIAHVHACRNIPGEIAARVLGEASVPYVISPNGTAPAIERRIVAKRVFDWTAGRQALRRSALVVAVSAAERRQLLGLGVSDNRIAVLPNPIDEFEFSAPRDPGGFRQTHELGDGPLVMFLGKLTPRKGVDVLLEAFARFQETAATLVIAGNDMGSERSIGALIVSLGLTARVRRIGLLTGSERLDALAAADVVVYPSRDEVFGLVAAEALLCRTPVVVSNDSGCGELVAEVGGGLFIPYGDAERLATAIAEILGAPGLWRQQAATAGDRVRARFGSATICERLERIYRAVLSEHAGAA
jgi:glycosyltransferase involved in cell wall biosynthesis